MGVPHVPTENVAEQFGDYELLRRLAFGGMAEVFLARQRRNGPFQKDLALKRILPHLSSEPSAVKMFLDEARIASHLSHPHIVQVFDFGEVQGRHYLAMEYLRGETLGGLIQRARDIGSPLPLSVVCQIAISVCDGLHYAHTYAENGQPLRLVHRDLSPSNVMVTYHGEVKVLDFGVAHAVGRKQDRTQAGFVKGKLAYCSPEQLDSDVVVDARSDIFSLAVLLHELLTGDRGFERSSEYRTGLAVAQEKLPPIASVRRDAPPALERILERALNKNPNKRHPTCLALREEFDALLHGEKIRLGDYLASLFGETHARARISTEGSGCEPPSPDVRSSPRHQAPTTLARTPTAHGAELKQVCPHSDGCSLFPLFRMNSLLNVWKVSFCEADHVKCARYKLSSAGKKVPLNLLPNGSTLKLENKG